MFGLHKLKITAWALSLPILANAAITCSELNLTVTAHSEAHDLSVPKLNLTDRNLANDLINSLVGDVGRLLPPVPVGGTYNIPAALCEPDESNAIPDTIQLLSHGGTYTKNYWLGHGLPDKEQREFYSWAHYAAKEGYASLSIDRLGAGQSTRADPLLEVQVNLSAEIVHEIVKKLRNGEIEGKKYSKIACAAHSLGSVVAASNAQRHPEDFDAMILTGWSGNLVENIAKVFTGGLLPAPLIDLERWGHLHPGYVAFSVKEATRGFFYGKDGTFDPKVETFDWNHRDTFSLGELVSIFLPMSYSPFSGPVHVLNGETDALFCSPLGTCSDDPDAAPGNTLRFFPNSRNFTSAFTPGAGHNLNLHYSADETYKTAHEFLRYNL